MKQGVEKESQERKLWTSVFVSLWPKIENNKIKYKHSFFNTGQYGDVSIHYFQLIIKCHRYKIMAKIQNNGVVIISTRFLGRHITSLPFSLSDETDELGKICNKIISLLEERGRGQEQKREKKRIETSITIVKKFFQKI